MRKNRVFVCVCVFDRLVMRNKLDRFGNEIWNIVGSVGKFDRSLFLLVSFTSD